MANKIECIWIQNSVLPHVWTTCLPKAARWKSAVILCLFLKAQKNHNQTIKIAQLSLLLWKCVLIWQKAGMNTCLYASIMVNFVTGFYIRRIFPESCITFPKAQLEWNLFCVQSDDCRYHSRGLPSRKLEMFIFYFLWNNKFPSAPGKQAREKYKKNGWKRWQAGVILYYKAKMWKGVGANFFLLVDQDNLNTQKRK